jgi:hypothetical protein
LISGLARAVSHSAVCENDNATLGTLPRGRASVPRRRPRDTLAAVGWVSKERQIATIVLVIGALIALFVFDVSAVFWVLIAVSLLLVAFDMWQKRRLSSH